MADRHGDDEPTAAELTRWLAREQSTRKAAEEIAERVTSELYAMTERQALTHRTLQAFVAMSSHDLRSPVASILGTAQLLITSGDRIDRDDQIRLLQGQLRAGRQLQRLVDDLFIMSTIEAGELRAKPEAVALSQAFEAVRASLPDPQYVVITDVPDVVVWCDPDHLQRILVNFVTNGLKYGVAPIHISAAVIDDEVQIRVRDHGPGVPEGFVPRLFKEFARADETASAIRGTGLGLAIVRHLTEANDGRVWYESADPGSCFAVEFRRATAMEVAGGSQS